MVFQNCLACGSVIDASLISRVNDFPERVAVPQEIDQAHIQPRPPTSVRHLARIEAHGHSEIGPSATEWVIR